jgi:hypothetical protein
MFRNVRELPDASLDSSSDSWKLVIDFPFDDAGHGPRDDLSQLQAFRQAHPEGTQTLAWLPNFFSADALKDLGMLVILEHILTGERFGGYAAHLSPQDRPAARSLLDNQCSVLRQRVRSHLEAAYGLEATLAGSLDTTHELEPHEQFQSLKNGFDPQPPVAANLKGSMDHLLDQALSDDYPAHPRFEAEIKKKNLQDVFEQVNLATRTEDGRVAVDKKLRLLLRQIANPLFLGEMGADATHFVLGQHWKNHLLRKSGETGAAMTVGQLRRWIDEPKPMGLPPGAQNLVILIFAEQTNRSFFEHGVPIDATLTNLANHMELREQKLPDQTQWDLAVQRAGSIFGVAVSPLRKASNVTNLTSQVKKKAEDALTVCQAYTRSLRDRLAKLGLSTTDAPRMKTGVATQTLVDRVHGTEPGEVVGVLATAQVATTESSMGECLSKAAELSGRLDATDWEILEAVGKLTDERKAEADEIHRKVQEALESDEHVAQLGAALKLAQSQAVRLLTQKQQPSPSPEPMPPVKPSPQPASGRKIISQGSKEQLGLPAAKELLAKLDKEADNGRTVELTITWLIEEGGDKP